VGKTSRVELDSYNNFCKKLSEGSVIYNVDTTNGWGEYLLVIDKSSICIGKTHTYSIILLGIQKERGRYLPRNLKISLTPENASNIPYLKYVGYCRYELFLVLRDVNINIGLAAAYGSTDLHKFTKNVHIRKPQIRKYNKDGKPVIKKNSNNN
jgi:hypothetical protein